MRVTRRQVRRTLGIYSGTVGGIGGGIGGVGVGMLLQHHDMTMAAFLAGFGIAMVTVYAVGLFLTSPRRNR